MMNTHRCRNEACLLTNTNNVSLNKNRRRKTQHYGMLLLALIFCLQARAGAQAITVNWINLPFKQALKEVEQKTRYRFVYTEEQLNIGKSVSVKAQQVSPETILILLFRDQPFTYVILDSTVVVRLHTNADNLPTVWTDNLSVLEPLKESMNMLPDDTTKWLSVVKGQVSDEQGKPMDRVTVAVKGSNLITLTDERGQFTLRGIDRNAQLLFNSVNTQPYAINLNGRSILVITLTNSIKQMKEVVVNTGYAQFNMKDNPGSFVKIDSELTRSVSSNILDRLYNVTSSLNYQPNNAYASGNQSALTIRGISSVNADMRPLVVVDGFPYKENYENNTLDVVLNNINPNDVESVTILRDAAAAAIWGVKSGNGVIVITTKKGNFGQKARISFNISLNFTEKPHLFSQPMIGPADYVELERTLFNLGYYNGNIGNTTTFPVLSPAVEILLKKKNGIISAENAENQLSALKNHDIRTDIDKYISQVAINQQYALNVSGGSGVFSYYVSGGYNASYRTNPYNHVKSGNDRVTFLMSNTFRPIQRLEINTYINYVQTTNKGQATSFSYTGNRPYIRLVDDLGNAVPVTYGYRSTYLDTANYPALLDWHYSPLTDPKYVQPLSKQMYARLGASIRYQVMPWLNAEVKYQYSKGQTNNETYYAPESYFVRNLVNQYLGVTPSGQPSYPIPYSGIKDNGNTTVDNYNLRGQLNLQLKWPGHSITAFAGAEIGSVKSSSLSGIRLYGYDISNGTAINTLNFDSLYNTRPGTTRARIPNTRYYSELLQRTVSSFANATWTFQEKYTLSGSVRIDGNNAFGVKTNQRIQPLWSSGLAWNIDQESFYHIYWLPVLKLRATYGYQGNTRDGATGYAQISYQSSSNINGLPYATLTAVPNLELHWEKVRMINVGVDFANHNNNISGSMDIYYKRGISLINSIPVDPTTGVLNFTGNGASIRGKGIDITVNTLNFSTRQWQWKSNFNFSYNTDKVTAYDFNTSAAAYVNGSPVINKPLFSLYSYRWAGLDPTNGDPRGYLSDTIAGYATVLKNNNAKISDLVYNGRLNPSIYGSLINTIRIKQLSISFNITYKMGYVFRRPSINYNNIFNGNSGHIDYLQRWQKPGDEQFTNVPSIPIGNNSSRDGFYAQSDILVVKGDHIRFRDIRINYDLNARAIRALSVVKQLQLYLYINNLGIIWRANAYHLDPDNPAGLQKPQRSIAIGLTTNF